VPHIISPPHIEKLQRFHRSEDENPYISPVLFIPTEPVYFKFKFPIFFTGATLRGYPEGRHMGLPLR
jgi:hypothetical protein